ncbi:MAG TPA: hypothetical protein VHL11_24440 [Phototrophicaceae bacterium]|jgi:hypothetical protein|nr:hypothetical protein [Phototrophicaceae bacterium]
MIKWEEEQAMANKAIYPGRVLSKAEAAPIIKAFRAKYRRRHPVPGTPAWRTRRSGIEVHENILDEKKFLNFEQLYLYQETTGKINEASSQQIRQYFKDTAPWRGKVDLYIFDVSLNWYIAFTSEVKAIILEGDLSYWQPEVQPVVYQPTPYPGQLLSDEEGLPIIDAFKAKYRRPHPHPKIPAWVTFESGIDVQVDEEIVDEAKFLNFERLYFYAERSKNIYEATPEQIQYFIIARHVWEENDDVYVFNDTMDWCIAFTHEEYVILAGDTGYWEPEIKPKYRYDPETDTWWIIEY